MEKCLRSRVDGVEGRPARQSVGPSGRVDASCKTRTVVLANGVEKKHRSGRSIKLCQRERIGVQRLDSLVRRDVLARVFGCGHRARRSDRQDGSAALPELLPGVPIRSAASGCSSVASAAASPPRPRAERRTAASAERVRKSELDCSRELTGRKSVPVQAEGCLRRSVPQGEATEQLLTEDVEAGEFVERLRNNRQKRRSVDQAEEGQNLASCTIQPATLSESLKRTTGADLIGARSELDELLEYCEGVFCGCKVHQRLCKNSMMDSHGLLGHGRGGHGLDGKGARKAAVTVQESSPIVADGGPSQGASVSYLTLRARLVRTFPQSHSKREKVELQRQAGIISGRGQW
jgi:hypothetical protein